MRIAFSPCPNDTFIFHAWVHQLIPGAPKLEVTYADIDITNKLATQPEGPEVLKISYGALPWVLAEYALLPCGGALGRGCGPLVLTSPQWAGGDNPARLAGGRIAVPSERSTAYLLFRLWAAEKISAGLGEIVVMPFNQIMPAVQAGTVDAGLVIHEARFTYPNYGLQLLADLGSWWEEDTKLPIPLGAIIARRTLDHEALAYWIRESLQYAWNNPQAAEQYILQHAQEMSPEVARAHIQLYVNQFSQDLGAAGYQAVESLLSRAAAEGLVPQVDFSRLLSR